MPVGTTTDWGSLAMAWLTEWERRGKSIARTKLVNGATTIAALPNGWVQSGAITYNLADGKFTGPAEPSVYAGSLSSVFGLIEVMTEVVALVDDEHIKEQWLNFCRLYNATKDEQRAVTGADWGNLNLRQAYSRATAYAADQLDDATLAARAWKELRTGHMRLPRRSRLHDPPSRRLRGAQPRRRGKPLRQRQCPVRACRHSVPRVGGRQDLTARRCATGTPQLRAESIILL